MELARLGWGQVAPNPLVGAVLVQHDRIVGEGYHARFGEAHAEVAALKAAGAHARGATLYVTLEPCGHHGKTPPCVDAILAAGIARVVVAVRDPNPVAAGGLERLAKAGVQVETGVGEAQARELNAAFLASHTRQRPWITLKMAITLDAAIADGTHTTSRITGPAARHFAHQLRAGHDAVAVGMSTVRIDDPQLTVREGPAPRVPPTRVVFSRTGRLSLTSTLANSLRQGPVLVTANEIDPGYEHALRQAGVDVVVGGDLVEVVDALGARGLRSILVEGGAGLAASLLEAALVDRLILVQSPTVFGAGALGAFSQVASRRAVSAPRWRVITREILGDDIATTYAIREG
ncbi:MAG: bifunctional diaminohydroxyphosphoribosylaminopyrimidine deaminase/5-amino-6-(5-phosphoribosylamino)uracil reductase RibD [Gemmatimonadetes bacterium]|nr:bifunctional diaminohydroxyphosphoribosylaminopyrimidine deaminase/5-amino-6-(5-phosphoribosylamino)uracil reductase RibD [Gemmatimonadota bacterium]